MGNGGRGNTQRLARGSEYDEELLSANWNPMIDLLAWSCGMSREVAKTPEGMTDADVDAFLDRIYTSGG